jgi:hypothetical protein
MNSIDTIRRAAELAQQAADEAQPEHDYNYRPNAAKMREWFQDEGWASARSLAAAGPDHWRAVAGMLGKVANFARDTRWQDGAVLPLAEQIIRDLG